MFFILFILYFFIGFLFSGFMYKNKNINNNNINDEIDDYLNIFLIAIFWIVLLPFYIGTLFGKKG